MKFSKKTLSILLSIIMLIGISMPALDVFASQSQMVSVASFNPLGNSLSPALRAPLDTTVHSTTHSYAGNTYYSEGRELYNVIKLKTEKRTVSFDIHTTYSVKPSTISLRSKIFNYVLTAASDELSTSTTDGDYIYWHLSDCAFSAQMVRQYNGLYYYDITITVNYRDTAAQQKKVDEVINRFVSNLNTNGKSDYQILKEVHDFICKSTTYDTAAAMNMDDDSISDYLYAFTSYGTLVTGKSVCQGYALAFYRICKELGYKCRFVSSNPNEGCHAWNIVELNGKYYFVDCTWDDESEDYSLFLVNYENSQKKDTYIRQHKLDTSVYNNDYFKTRYEKYFAPEDYDSTDEHLLTNCAITISSNKYTYTSNAFTPSVKVTNPLGEALTGTSFITSYSNNTNCGEGKVYVKGVGDYAGSISHRLFTISPKALSSFKASATATTVKLSWTNANSGLSGFELEKKKDGKYTKIATPSATTKTYTEKSLSACKTYSYRIRAYKSINHRTVYSPWIYVSAVTPPKAPTLSSLKTKSKAITVKWKKTNCTGYQIQYSLKKDMSKPKTANASNTATTKKISKLKKGKKYYVRIRAKYVKTDSAGKKHTYWGKWSGKKSITVK